MWADILASISGILLILVVLIQQSEDDIQDAFSGAKSELFKNRKEQTLDIVLRNATTILSILFIGFVIVSYVIHN
ncbi:MAG TPA: preprotein translocase subunit SecG [Acholeplasma sp.]|jgi:preprotein translocase subunit SecG|nr:preprotein translocase subunit SecG [Acholeplasma sp.]